MKATLTRVIREDNQTRGYLDVYNGDGRIFTCKTLELPYLENQTNISCVPCGVYELNIYDSPSKGEVYLFRNVIDRSFVEIHSGNYYNQIQGCVLVGDNFIDIDGDGMKDVTNSRHTLDQLKEATKKQTIQLTIINQY